MNRFGGGRSDSCADAEALATLQMQKNQLLEASQALPDPSAHSSLPGLFQCSIDDCVRPGRGTDGDSAAEQVQQLQRYYHQCLSSRC